MARASDVDAMSYAELTKMEGQIQRLKVQKQSGTFGATPEARR